LRQRLETPVVGRSHDTPAWRVFGAGLGVFAIVVQLVFAAWLIVDAAAAANPSDLTSADLGVICTHSPAATGDDTGAPPAPHPHGQCPACACPQSAKLLAPLPTPPVLAVLRPGAQTRYAHAAVAAPQPRSPAAYASRAPPLSA
jgi:hypothetical protein